MREGEYDKSNVNCNKSNIIIPQQQDTLWMKPFTEFAPRMRVMRYASERRLQMPNLAAHYKKELRVLLQVWYCTSRITRHMSHVGLSCNVIHLQCAQRVDVTLAMKHRHMIFIIQSLFAIP